MAPLRALLLVCLALSAHRASASLKDTIQGAKKAHDIAAATARLKHVESLVPTSNVDLASVTIPADDESTVQVYTTDTSPSDAPSACSSALTATVACNSTILDLGDDEEFETDDLDLMCTAACTKSLNAYRASVASACGTYMITDPFDGSLYPPTLAADTILANYNTACEKDTTGTYCSTIFATYPTVPSDQGVLGWPTADLCTACTIGALNITVSNPSTWSVAAWAALQSALKTCGSAFSAYNVTNPPTASAASLSVPGPSPTPLGSNSTSSVVCALTGRNVTVSSNSTCAALGKQYSITAFDVLQNNPVLSNANCTDGILPGASLCIPQACTLFTPNGTQTCDDVISAVNSGALAGAGQKITSVQLLAWNPNLRYPCLTLTVLDSATPICITPHGGWPSVAADPSANGGNPAATPTAVVPPPGPTAPGTTAQCGEWVFATNGTSCEQLLLNSGVTFDDFRELNTMVDENCYNLWANYWYCIVPYPPLDGWAAGPTITPGQATITMYTTTFPAVSTATSAPYDIPGPAYDTPPDNIAPGTITAGCSYYYNVTTADAAASNACNTLATTWGMDPTLFAFYNNDTAHPCPQLLADTSVCLMVLNTTAAGEGMGPPNKQPGSGPYGCASFYTIVSGDGCASVEAKFGLTATQFFTLNPELKTDCTNLVLGAAYCVSPPPAAAIPSPTTTTTSAGPTPTIAPGSWTNCTTYYQVQSGDNCPAIEAKYSISQSDFLLWNPEIKGDCSNLDIQNYCVAGSPAACGKTYIVVSGDYCSLIESKNGISDATLRSLNPWIDTNCDLQVGQGICVAPPSSAPKNIAPGSWTNCTSYYQVVANDNCNKIETQYGISLTDLLKWNSGLNSACSNLLLDSYCVAGSPESCGKTYTVVSGDYCSLVESKNGVTDATLRSLNPWLDANCDMQVGQNLCVAAASTAPSQPTDIAPGTWTNCTTYYQVVANDNCNKIETQFGISLTDLLKWNTGLNSGCSNLLLDSYCVAGSPQSCGKTYTVVSGDYCSLVESKNGVTDATLRALNPWLDANCDMQVGQNLCVAAAAQSKPTDIAPGTWTNCTSYYQVVANDNCNKIEATFGLSFTDLLKWNTGINTGCTNLALDSYCVAASPKTCKKTYTVVSGDYCSLVESKNGVTDATLRSLNPWLDANCDFQVGQVLCVG